MSIKRFYELKSQRKYVDFNDLEHKTIEAFQNPQIANSYRNHIKYIFVEQYQDTNSRALFRVFVAQIICFLSAMSSKVSTVLEWLTPIYF